MSDSSAPATLSRIENHIRASIEAKQKILGDAAALGNIAEIANVCIRSLQQGGKILFAGNGGSASDAQHLAAELVGRYKVDRAPLAAIALTTDTSALTAIGNDYSFDDIYSRQVAALARSGDVFVGISTSGNSANIIKACEVAREQGCTVIGMTGARGIKGQTDKDCQLLTAADYMLAVPSSVTATIQESHIMLGHILCDYIEQALISH